MNDENMKLEKIKKSSNAAMIITRIAKIICIAMAVICVGIGMWLIAFSEPINTLLLQAEAAGEFSIEEFSGGGLGLFGLFYVPAGSFIRSGQLAKFLGMYVLAAGALLSILAVTFHFVGRVFLEIKENDSPFRQTVLRYLRVVFVLITLMILQDSLLIGAVAGFSLWCVLQIFEYGCGLQQLSDETL